MKKLLMIILFTPIFVGMSLTALAADGDRGGGGPIPGNPPVFSDVTISPVNVWAPAGKKVPVKVSGVVSAFPGSEVSSMSFYLNNDTGSIVPGNITVGEGGSFSGTVMVDLSKDGQTKEGKSYNGMIYAQDSAGRLSMKPFSVTVLHDRGK